MNEKMNGLNKPGISENQLNGGLSMAGVTGYAYEDQLTYATQNVNRQSSPSELRITDMRIAEISDVVFRTPIIRIYTNQGIVGHGDVRDGAAKEYALMLKSRIVGENPCNIEKIFKIIRQFGYHGRQGGGVSGVEMALWDLAGKAYGVPVYQLLGGKYRDRVRLYADTTTSQDPQVFANRLLERKNQGYTSLKMDIGIGLLQGIPDTLVNSPYTNPNPWTYEGSSYNLTEHPFTRVQITEKGIDRMMEYLAVTRDTIGYEIPLGVDHWGHIDKNEAIKLNRAAEPYNLAYSEDSIPWYFMEDWKKITEASTTPTLTGEDIFGLEGGFKQLIDMRAIDMVHPDPNTAGGILETKRIGDYAAANGIGFMHHHAAGPISFMGCVHSAAATEHFYCLEHHAVDNPDFENLVSGIEKPIVQGGYVNVPETPGLGVELNEEVVREYLIEGEELFAPTPEWDEIRSWDRIWS